jgi:hypothetical protein
MIELLLASNADPSIETEVECLSVQLLFCVNDGYCDQGYD